jgi:hypothetical protein
MTNPAGTNDASAVGTAPGANAAGGKGGEFYMKLEFD